MLRSLAFWLMLFLVFTVPWEYLYRVDDMTMVSRAVGVVVAGAWALCGGLSLAPSGEPSLAPVAKEMNGAARAEARTPAFSR